MLDTTLSHPGTVLRVECSPKIKKKNPTKIIKMESSPLLQLSLLQRDDIIACAVHPWVLPGVTISNLV